MPCFSVFCRRFFHWMRSLFWKRQLELAIVGLEGCGKSTFLHLLSSGNFNAQGIPTIGAKLRKFTKDKVDIRAWDLGGLAHFRSSWIRYCRGVGAIVFMLDGSDPRRLPNAKWELRQLLAASVLEGIPLLVLANKADLMMNRMEEGEFIAKLGLEDECHERQVGCLIVSCRDGRNVEDAIEWLLKNGRI